jgi:hypothetical protein
MSNNSPIIKSLKDAHNLLREFIGNDPVTERFETAITLFSAADVLVKAAEEWDHMLTTVRITNRHVNNHDGDPMILDEQLREYKKREDELRAALHRYTKLVSKDEDRPKV